jgi:hypothetical protein
LAGCAIPVRAALRHSLAQGIKWLTKVFSLCTAIFEQ